jgi:PAS domain S-box-containing protein
MTAQQLRLLLVEDVEDDALLLVRELRRQGYEPDFTRVETAEELKAALAGGPWDAMFADYNLPAFTGLDALRIVKESGLDLPFILVSGVMGEETAVEALQAGAHDYLMKGRFARLGQALQRALRDAALRQERRRTAEELTQHREHLEELVQQRTEDLAAANEELQAQSEELQTQSEDLISSMEDLRRVDKELRAANGRINSILEQMSDGFASFDLDWRYTQINAAAAKAFKMSPEQLLGKTIWEMWPPAYDLPLGINFRRSLQENIPIQFETYYPAPLDRWFECRCHPTTEGLATFFSDITERKRAEEEKERLIAELEAANVEMEAFNYTVSHDLRGPLTHINGYCQVLQQLCSDRLDAECKGYLAEAANGTLKMATLIDTLLRFSRLTHAELRRNAVDLGELAGEIIGELRMKEPGRAAAVTIAQGLWASGDRELLRVLLENLLGNAWKYTARKEGARIELGVTTIAGETVYFVRDNGEGFDMAHAEKLFIPFRRLPGAEEFKGHGIGLATVQRIIQRHSGRVWAEGKPGEGATFYFTLP